MKNSDAPAKPCGLKWKEKDHFTSHWVDQSRSPMHSGLTKREMFAMHIMQGLATNGAEDWLANNAPSLAVKIADTLLEKLQEQEQTK